jgi:uncharacterized membrane protein YbhN (UPF0104 family)
VIWRSRLAVLVGLAMGAGFLALAVSRLDLAGVALALREARLWPWLPLAMASYLAGHFVRGRRLRGLVSREASLTTLAATNVVVVGYAVNNLLPARLGELARAWMLTERSGLSLVQSLTVTVLERVLDGVVLVLLLTVTLLFAGGTHPAGTFALAAAMFGIAGTIVLLAVFAPGPLLTMASRMSQRLAPRWHDAALRNASAVVNGVAYLRSPGGALRATALGVIVWLFEAGMFLCLLPAFGIPARPWTALLAMTTTNLGILLPSTPGYIGPFHYFCMQAVTSTGVAPDVAFGYAVLVHLTFYVPITLWGLGVLLAHGLSIGRTLALSGTATPLATLPAVLAGVGTPLSGRSAIENERRLSRFMVALSEAALPLAEDEIAPEDRAVVVPEVAAFVDGQIGALPLRLRALFSIGSTGFRVATRLRYLRGFCEIAPPVRHEWFERWAYGPVALARQLFRGVRLTALLAYYEQPAVRHALDARVRRAEGG